MNYLNNTGPIEGAAAVTPSDDTDLTNYARALWVGTGGNIVVVPVVGSVYTLTNVQDGTLLPVKAKRVNNTDTTASDIVALW